MKLGEKEKQEIKNYAPNDQEIAQETRKTQNSTNKPQIHVKHLKFQELMQKKNLCS